MKVEPGVDYQNDWKILTVLIGANDLCNCESGESRTEVWEKTIQEALIEVQKSIPKVFVNLISIFETGFTDVWNNGQKKP